MVHVPLVVNLNDSQRPVLTCPWGYICAALPCGRQCVASIKAPPTRYDQRARPAILRNDFLVLEVRLWKSSQTTLIEQKKCVSVLPSITPAGTGLFHLNES